MFILKLSTHYLHFTYQSYAHHMWTDTFAKMQTNNNRCVDWTQTIGSLLLSPMHYIRNAIHQAYLQNVFLEQSVEVC